jgi:hypothetical protein
MYIVASAVEIRSGQFGALDRKKNACGAPQEYNARHSGLLFDVQTTPGDDDWVVCQSGDPESVP